jgi:hypothetical protein
MLMPTIHLHQTTTATPEQLVAGITDFGPGRSEIFPNSADDYLEVHDKGASEADVTEGSKGAWERLHYDWSDPNRIVMTTTDSNVWANSSIQTYSFKREPDGTTEVDAVVERHPRSLRGRAIAGVLAVGGKQFLGGALKKTVKAVEARNGG